MKQIRMKWWFLLLVFIVPVCMFAVVTWYERKLQRLPVLGGNAGHRIGTFRLANQDNNSVDLNTWKDKIIIVDFFFTRCPSMCPRMTNSLKKVQKAYETTEILINSFSVDPENDDPSQLRNYCGRFDINTENWHLLTGNKKGIYSLARNSFQVVATDGDGGPTDFIHSEKLVLIDKQKRIRGYYSGTDDSEVDQLIRDIKKIQNEK